MMSFSEAKKIIKRDLDIMIKNKALPDGIEAMKTAIIALDMAEQQYEPDKKINKR